MKKTRFILGIDASNVRAGGGFNHLVELLKAADPLSFGINQIIIWCNQRLFDALPDRPWLEKINVPSLNRNIFYRLFWQHFRLPLALRHQQCDALFSPGGLSPLCPLDIPTVVMSANMLPFEKREYKRYPLLSYGRLRLRLLRMGQSRSFGRASLMIFLAPYAKKIIVPLLKKNPKNVAVIPHGIEPRFLSKPRLSVGSDNISPTRPFRFLYISSIDVYKHQWHVAEAAKILVQEGFCVQVDFIGSTYSYPPALKRFEKTKNDLDPHNKFLFYRPFLPFEEVHRLYQEADAFVYASSCENLPNILIEAMASGLPIVCSDRGPMPGVLGDGGLYFDPESPKEIAARMRDIILNPDLRSKLAHKAHDLSRQYSWKTCAHQTFLRIGEMLNSTGNSALT